MMTQGDDMRTLDERLRASNPIQTAALRQPTLDAALTRIVDELPAGGSDDTRSVRRWRGRLTGASLGTVAAVGFAGVAAAGGIALGSGFFDSPDSTESISGEEYVNVASEQFPAVFDAAAKAYPLPPGETYDEVRQNVLGTGGLIQVSGLRGQLALYSGCRWAVEYAEATPQSAESAAAVQALANVADSPDLAAIDGGGIVSQVSMVSEAAANGDQSTVANYAAECSQ